MHDRDRSCFISDLLSSLSAFSTVVTCKNVPFRIRKKYMSFCLNSIETLITRDPLEFTDDEIQLMESLVVYIRDVMKNTGYIDRD